MGIIRSSIRLTEDLAAAATSAAGAAAGAAAGGAVGAVGGGLRGVSEGLGLGSRSLPAAALTLAAVGATGLIDWPIILAVGGTALILRQLRPAAPTQQQPASSTAESAALAPRGTRAPAKRRASAAVTPPRKATARKAAAPNATARKATA